MKKPASKVVCLKERKTLSLSVCLFFAKDPAAPKACCVPPSQRGPTLQARGGPASPVSSRAAAAPPAIWTLVLDGLCLAVVPTELNGESIFSSLSACLCPPGLAPPRTARGRHVMPPRWKQSTLLMGSFVFSSGPAAPTPNPSLPLFRKRGELTLSAAAGTFENNCLYDCYFSYLFEEV